MNYKVDYKQLNKEWDDLKVLDNSKPNLDKKWVFIYSTTLRFAKAILSRENRYLDDIDGRVLDQVCNLIERIKKGFEMESAKYCSLLAMAATHNRSKQEKFEENIYEELNGEDGYARLHYESEWNNYITSD